MQSPYDDSAWDSSEYSRKQIFRFLPLIIFLVFAGASMFAVYRIFGASGTAGGESARIFSAGYSAPIHKAVPAKPVQQRLVQSRAPLRIGIISGHKGNDPGAVCEDGLTEEEVNLVISELVVAGLRERGIRTDLLDEFDPRLIDYSATALVSIHADSCDYFNEEATGYKVADSFYTDSTVLMQCIEEVYGSTTQLPYHANTITPHMTDYHAFHEIAEGTPAVIIETGFMNLDRDLLLNRPEVASGAIMQGIDCFLDAVQ